MTEAAAQAPAAVPAAAEAPAHPAPAVAPEAAPDAAAQAAALEQKKQENYAKKLLEADLETRKLKKQLKDAESLRSKVADYESKLERLKKSPFEAMGELGVKVDDFLAAQAAGLKKQEPSETEVLRQEIEALKAERQREAEERTQQLTRAQHAQVIDQMRGELAKDDRFPLVSAFDHAPVVVDRIIRFMNEHGTPSPHDQARIALEVEQEIESTLHKQVERLAALPKARALFLKYFQTSDAAPAASEQSSSPSQQENGATWAGSARKKRKPTSLTNRDAAKVETRGADNKRSSDRDRIARAVNAWRAR